MNNGNLMRKSKKELIKMINELENQRHPTERNSNTKFKHMGEDLSDEDDKNMKFLDKIFRIEDIHDKEIKKLKKEEKLELQEKRKTPIEPTYRGSNRKKFKSFTYKPIEKRNNNIRTTREANTNISSVRKYEVNDLVEVVNKKTNKNYDARILFKGPGTYQWPATFGNGLVNVPTNMYLVQFTYTRKLLWDIIGVGRENANSSGDYIFQKVKGGYDGLPKNLQNKLKY